MTPIRGTIYKGCRKGCRIPYGALSGLPVSHRVRISEIVAGSPRYGCGCQRPGAPGWLTAHAHEDSSQLDPLQILLHAEATERAGALTGRLDERSWYVLMNARAAGLGGMMTLGDVGREYRITKERVRQIIEESIAKLRAMWREGEGE